jgi:gamma-glutamyltranspeptidase / glutathione hydrolase
MKPHAIRRPLALAALFGVASLGLLGASPPPAHSRGGMVASDHRLASEAGASVLRKGGNAVDAAVAAALAAGVVQPAGSGLGGGGFAVVVMADGQRSVLDFREVAPAAATPDMFVNAPAKDASTVGGLAVGVPGEGPGLMALHTRMGSLPLAKVVEPATRLARGGFDAGPHLVHSLANKAEEGLRLAGLLFGLPALPGQGDTLRNAALGRTLAAMAGTRGRTLVDGPVARDIVKAVRKAGGILTAEDLATYAPRDREPIVGEYRGWTVVTMPPPSSGGIVLLQTLQVLEGFEVSSWDHDSAQHLHMLAEVFQHAYADRAAYMGDPDRVTVPVDAMLAAERIGEIRRQILPSRTFDKDFYGTRIDIGSDAGTQHISVVDDDGMSVALTTTINTSFGSRVVAPRSGIVLNNEMDDFVARPGVPNAYGLVGTEANAVHAGSRPLSSMSPTVLISKDGKQRIVVGGSGGPVIISGTLQVISNIIDFGMDPSAAVSAPRVHHQWVPEALMVDEEISVDTVQALEARGHVVRRRTFGSSIQVVVRDADGTTTGASDPRKGGWPAGL